MKTLPRLFVLLAGSALLFAQPGRVVINEVLFATDPASTDPLRTHQWLELANPTPDPVDLAGYTITGRAGLDGPSARKLPSISLPPGAYLVIHFTNGTDRLDFSDGTGDFFAGDSGTPFWDELMDDAALYSADSITDFVAWSSGSKPYQGAAAHEQAVAAKIWTQDQSLNSSTISHSLGEQVRVLLRGESIGRDGYSSDTDAPADFDAHGGRHAIEPTPGRFNGAPQPYQLPEEEAAPFSARDKSPVRAAEPPKTKKWTVMLYFGGDNNLGATLFQQLDEISRAGGSTDDVNYVTFSDLDGVFETLDPNTRIVSRTRIRATVRGLISSSFAGNRRFAVPEGEQSELGERNSADPNELRAFIEWTKKFYPAERYALIINSHGNGWKGVVQDASIPGKRESGDHLYMGELKKALKGHEFELIAFHACMMASIEVAAQIKDNAKYMVASEELIVTQAFPFFAAAQSLNARPGQDGNELGLLLVDNVKQNYLTLVPRMLDSADGVKFWTISLLDLKKMDALLTEVDNWAKELLSAMSWLATRNLFDDNAQMRVKVHAEAATRFADDNFMDLDDFARRVQADAAIPACAKRSIPALRTALESQVVLKHLRSDAYANTYGLHIHFPRYRTGFNETKLSFGINAPNSTYDAPRTRLLDGNSPLGAYAPNYDALPLQARDEEEPETGLPAPLVWPRIATPDFNFVFSGNTWPKFLNRYYHPTADAHIEQVLDMNGAPVPFTLGTLIGDSTTACATPSETVVVPANGTAVVSGEGSSDPDTIGRITPTHHFWDLDGNTGCKKNCIAPTEVPAGGNAALDSTDNKDQDQDPTQSLFDQQDAAGVSVQFKCSANVAPFTPVTLTVWDDNHTYRLHDTRPGAAFVHPQTNRQKVYIYCMPTPVIEIPVRPELWFVEYGAYVKLKLTNPDGTPAANRTITGESSTGTDVAPPPSGTGEVLVKSVTPVRSATVRVTTDREGSAYVLVTPRRGGSGEVAFSSPGFAPQKLQFDAIVPNDPPGDNLQLSAPAALTFNTPAAINATVVGQQGPVSLVTFLATSGNIRFDDNRQFADKTGTQAYTQSGGGTRVSFTPIAGGVAQIIAISGKTTKTLTIPITGGTPPANTLQLTGLPGLVPLGGTGAITATVLAGTQPVAGAQVLFQVDQGNLTLAGALARATQFTISTDARGVATQRFTANAEGGVRMTVKVNGTSLAKLVLFGVEPAPR